MWTVFGLASTSLSSDVFRGASSITCGWPRTCCMSALALITVLIPQAGPLPRPAQIWQRLINSRRPLWMPRDRPLHMVRRQPWQMDVQRGPMPASNDLSWGTARGRSGPPTAHFKGPCPHWVCLKCTAAVGQVKLNWTLNGCNSYSMGRWGSHLSSCYWRLV